MATWIGKNKGEGVYRVWDDDRPMNPSFCGTWLPRDSITGDLPKDGECIEVTLVSKAVPVPKRARELWGIWMKNWGRFAHRVIGDITTPELFTSEADAKQYLVSIKADSQTMEPRRYDTCDIEENT